jgi:hypothetical protein
MNDSAIAFLVVGAALVVGGLWLINLRGAPGIDDDGHNPGTPWTTTAGVLSFIFGCGSFLSACQYL